MKPILLLDQDGPLADFDLHSWNWCQQAGIEFDIESPADQRHRFLADHIPNKFDRQCARFQVDNTQWFRHLPVTPGAKEGVPQLMEHFDVWVCSKPLEKNIWCASDKFDWIAEHFPELVGKLILAPDKSMVHGHILIDDAIHHTWPERATWEPIVFTTPWNGITSNWENHPHWCWDDGIDGLMSIVHDVFDWELGRGSG